MYFSVPLTTCNNMILNNIFTTFTKLFDIARSVILDPTVEPPLFYLNILTTNPYPHRIMS